MFSIVVKGKRRGLRVDFTVTHGFELETDICRLTSTICKQRPGQPVFTGPWIFLPHGHGAKVMNRAAERRSLR